MSPLPPVQGMLPVARFVPRVAAIADPPRAASSREGASHRGAFGLAARFARPGARGGLFVVFEFSEELPAAREFSFVVEDGGAGAVAAAGGAGAPELAVPVARDGRFAPVAEDAMDEEESVDSVGREDEASSLRGLG